MSLLSEATTIEKTLEMRTRQFNRRSTPGYADIQSLCSDDLRETIRAVVREEIRRMFPSCQPQAASITDIVREEIQQSLGIPESAQPQLQAMSYAAAARRTAPAPRPRQVGAPPQQFRRHTPPSPPPTSYRPPAGQQYTPRKTDVWRAPDTRPLCYHCGEAGPTDRRCQCRQMGLR